MVLKEETNTHRRCTRVECAYYINGGCKNCESCGSEEYTINKTCERCLACENIPDSLRWGDKHAVELKALKELILMIHERLDEIAQEQKEEQKRVITIKNE